MIKSIVLSFFITQVIFTVLDLAVLYRQKKTTGSFEWADYKESVLFIFGIWLVYLLVQTAGAGLLPGVNTFKDHFFQWLQIPGEGDSRWTWKVTLMLLWSFHVIGFFDFATHRWILHKKYFWFFHEYHHLPKMVFNGMPGISVRPYAFLATLLTYVGSVYFIFLPLKYFLVPDEVRAFLEMALPVLIFILALVLAVGHSLWLRQMNSVHSLLQVLLVATPHEHVLHHSNKLRCNYGNFVTIWDRLFGSYVDPMKMDFENEPLGLSYDQDHLGALCRGRLKFSRKHRERFRMKDIVCLKD